MLAAGCKTTALAKGGKGGRGGGGGGGLLLLEGALPNSKSDRKRK